MKVALIDPSLFTWPYDIALAKGLVANGHEVAIYARSPFSPLDPADLAYLRPHFYRWLESSWTKRLPKKIFLGLKALSHIGSMIRLAGMMRRERPDIIHFQWTPAPLVDRLMLPLFRKTAPLVFTVHDSQPFNDNPSSRLQGVGAISIMRHFDRLIVHTEKAHRRVIDYAVPAGRIARIAHGILGTLPSPTGKARPKAADDRLTLLLFGYIKPYKGTDILLKAVAKLPAALGRQCRVLVVGRPRMAMEPLYELVESLGLRDRVEFDLRFIDDDEIGDLLRSADIQMFPYTEIDASGVLMQVMGIGKPIIATQVGLFKELLNGHRHGGLVPPNDIDALSAAIGRLIADPELRAQCGRAVAELSASIPGWNDIGCETARLYEEAIAERSGAQT